MNDQQVSLDIDEQPTPKSNSLKRHISSDDEIDHTEDIDLSDEDDAEDIEEIINDAITNWMDLNLAAYVKKCLPPKQLPPKNLSSDGYRNGLNISSLQQK